MKTIPKKNYIIFAIIILVSILLCLYIVKFYKNYKKNKDSKPFLSEVIYEIVPNEKFSVSDNLNNYLTENSDLIIYISSSKDEKIKIFEAEFLKFIIEKNLNKRIVYINSENINYKKFITELKGQNNDINLEIPKNNIPVLIIFKNKKLQDIYIDSDITIEKINFFLLRNGVIYND